MNSIEHTLEQEIYVLDLNNCKSFWPNEVHDKDFYYELDQHEDVNYSYIRKIEEAIHDGRLIKKWRSNGRTQFSWYTKVGALCCTNLSLFL